VATEPDGVTIGTVVSVAGTVTVVVPPYGVKTDEISTDEATETVSVPPYEVTTVVEVTADDDDGVETNDEAETGTEATDPDSVMICSVTYGAEVPGVETVMVDPP